MRLVFYSGGRTNRNGMIHQEMFELLHPPRRGTFTYVPNCLDGSREFYERAVERYRKFGFRNFQCLPIDTPIADTDLRRALKSEVIYLAGGNTFYFLHHLRKQKLMRTLRTFARDGGVIAGLSAGAIIMTPHIGLAGYPPFDADENEVELTQLNGLNLVRFEFFPHYDSSDERLHRALARYSRVAQRSIIAAEDGGGLVINGEETTLFGRVFVYQAGHRAKLSFV